MENKPLDLEAIKAREKAANDYAVLCVGLDAEDWIVHGYGARNMKKDFVALIAEVKRLREKHCFEDDCVCIRCVSKLPWHTQKLIADVERLRQFEDQAKILVRAYAYGCGWYGQPGVSDAMQKLEMLVTGKNAEW